MITDKRNVQVHNSDWELTGCILMCDIMHIQKIFILPPQKGLEFPGEWRGSVRPKNLKKCVKLYWNFQKGGGSLKKSFPLGRYGYFLELHIKKKTEGKYSLKKEKNNLSQQSKFFQKCKASNYYKILKSDFVRSFRAMPGSLLREYWISHIAIWLIFLVDFSYWLSELTSVCDVKIISLTTISKDCSSMDL